MMKDKRNNYDNNSRRDEINSKDVDTRLNKFISNAGICSRRDADILIRNGKVTVDGEIITEMGYKVLPDQKITVDGKIIKRKSFEYYLLNKPKGYLSTTRDPENRKTVMELMVNATKERLYPVGRLDRNTTGLLLLTNDGDLANELTHPSMGVGKIYSVTLDKNLKQIDLKKLVEGVELEDGIAIVDEAAFIDEADLSQVGVKLHSGKNRIVRRMFEAIGYEVIKLDRVGFSILTKKDLPRGKWRKLQENEVRMLRMDCGKVTSKPAVDNK
ncbi:MAG: pseudouridine synthase [Bacteroidota bacterium]|nr:pseudouridine synthase [Bacteroidota bacterium]